MSSGIHCEDDPVAGGGARDDAASLRALADRLFLAQEARMRSVALQLHNGAGQALTAITMAAHAAMREPDATQRTADLEEIVAQARAALDQVREICGLLRPPPLDAVGLDAALRWHVAQLQTDTAPAVLVESHGLRDRPTPEVEQACFRIAEQALANALAHSGAQSIRVRVDELDDGLVMEVHDDGCGFDPASGNGPGLTEMRERARGIGASMRVDSRPGRGTCVRVHVPRAGNPAAGAAA